MFLGRLHRETETLKKNAHARASARAVAQTHFLLATHARRTCARKRASTKCSFVTTGRETATLNYGAGSWRGVGARRHREAGWLSRKQESRGRRHGSGGGGRNGWNYRLRTRRELSPMRDRAIPDVSGGRSDARGWLAIPGVSRKLGFACCRRVRTRPMEKTWKLSSSAGRSSLLDRFRHVLRKLRPRQDARYSARHASPPFSGFRLSGCDSSWAPTVGCVLGSRFGGNWAFLPFSAVSASGLSPPFLSSARRVSWGVSF